MQEHSGEQAPEPDGEDCREQVNPYAAGSVLDRDDAFSQEACADLRLKPSRPRPRIWPSLVLPLLSLVTFFTASLVMIVVAFYVVHGELDRRMLVSSDAMKTVSASRVGFLLLVVIPQLALVLPCVVAAFLSPVPTAKRLSLVRGHWPLWAWVAAAMATPLIGWISSIVVGSLMVESENLKLMSDIFRGHGESGFLIPLALLIGATPAVCEELLFRGYVQTRLNRSIGPAVGIILSSLLFALFHMDWVHIIAVFPLGLYLGFIAWRSGSLFPAMLGHFVNNTISVFAVVLGPEQQGQAPSNQMVLFLLTVVSAGLFGAVLTAIAIWRLPVPNSNRPPDEPEIDLAMA